MQFLKFLAESSNTIKLSSIDHEVQGNGFILYELTYKKNGVNIFVTANIDFVDSTEDAIKLDKKHLEIVRINFDGKIQDVIDFVNPKSTVMDAKPKVSKELADLVFKDIEKYNTTNVKEIHKELQQYEE